MARHWRPPTLEDRKRKCRAKNPYERYPFYVEWNETYHCWGRYGRPHILILVCEILSPKIIETSTTNKGINHGR